MKTILDLDFDAVRQLALDASEEITKTLNDPSDHSEAVLDRLLREGRDVTDAEVVWSRRRPLGAERVFDLSDLLLTLEGPLRGPTQTERGIFKEYLTKGDRLSTMSRPSQWVVTTSRGRSCIAWLLQHPPGEEGDPEAPVYGDPEGWAVWPLTTMAHFRREGRLLNHCVGSPSAGYLSRVRRKETALFSVRHNNEPVCTVQVTDGQVVQTQGKAGRNLNEIGGDAAAVWKAWMQS